MGSGSSATVASDISVVMLVRNGGALCQETLRAVVRQETDRTFEVLLVDSSSDDGTPELTRELFADPRTNPRRIPLRIMGISRHDFNFSATRNLAVREAAGGIVVFLSHDATPKGAHWLETLIRPFAQTRIVATYCRQVPRRTASLPEQFILKTAYGPRSTIHSPSALRGFNASSVLYSNASGAIRRQALADIPFDEQLLGCEDQHWALQALAAGHDIAYIAEAQVEHSHHYSLSAILTRAFDNGVALASLPGGIGSSSYLAYLDYLRHEIGFVACAGGPCAMPWMAAFEGVRSIGYLLGTHYERLPFWLCRELTGYPSWFRRPRGSVREAQPR
jgi:rhamnosyltransferase